MAISIYDPLNDRGAWKSNTAFSVIGLLMVVYCWVRVAILVLVFLELRDLPFAAYVTQLIAFFASVYLAHTPVRMLKWSAALGKFAMQCHYSSDTMASVTHHIHVNKLRTASAT